MTAEEYLMHPSPEGDQDSNTGQQYRTSNEKKQSDGGSGLALFFRDSLPPTDNATYSTSLAEIPVAMRPGVSQEMDMKETTHTTTGTKTPMMTFKEWRELHKHLLMEFLGRRLTEERDSDEESSDEDNTIGLNKGVMQEERAVAEEEECNTQPETQPLFATQDFRAEVVGGEDDQDSPGQPPSKRHKISQPKRVPHIEDTLHEVSKLEFLDLYTQKLHLPLCQVLKVWNVRDTKRGAFYSLSGIAKACPSFDDGRMTRIPFGEMEEDGPVSSAFRSVVSMELEQLKLTDSAAASHGTKQRRIKVFFYNLYAEKIAGWMKTQRKQKQHDFLIGLSHIPAVCIFPRAIDPNSWLDQHNMVEYCICIGDASSAKIVNDGSYIRFDDEGLQVTITSKSTLEKSTNDKVDHRPEDVMLLSQKNCNDGFLSSSEESNPAKFTANAFKLLQAEWSNYCSHLQTCPTRNTNQEPQIHQNQQQTFSGLQLAQGSDRDRQPTNGNNPSQNSTSTEQTSDLHPRMGGEPFTAAPMTVVGTAARQLHTDDTEYVQLCALEHIRAKNKKERTRMAQNLNIYAVVLGFTSPSQTRRGDWKLSTTLVDPSCTKPITLTMYFRSAEGLPKLACMGDVLRIHRAKIDEFKEDVHLFAPKFMSSYVVVRKTEPDEWKMFPTALNTFSFDSLDAERTQKLWLWGQNFIKEFSTINQQHCFTLAEMNAINDSDEEHLKDRDITVMIAGVFPYPEMPSGVNPRGFLRVWDGTGIAPSDPYPIQTILTQQAAGRGDPPSEALLQVVTAVKDLQATHSNMEIPLSFCGRVANAVIWEESMWALIRQHAPVGSFVRLRNVSISRWTNNPFRSLMVHDYTWLTPLPNHNFEVQELLRKHNERVIRREYNPGAGLLPDETNTVTSGLTVFVDDEDLGVFTGTVQVMFVPQNMTREQLKQKLNNSDNSAPILFVLRDQSGSVTAMASEKVREKLSGLSNDISAASIWDDLEKPDKTFIVNVRSINWNNHRYFVLKDLT